MSDLLLVYYGDDFTGSTDTLEAMSAAGVPTVLFLKPPSPEDLARFPGVRCVGLAGDARGRSPEWMEAHLPTAFASLKTLGAPILQYKVCSTFDSAPHVGNIGRAIEIGTAIMPAKCTPIIVGVPRLKRYTAFAHLFASVNGEGHRIDRHPTMSRHPVTPMHEADVRLHLRKQTDLPVGLIDFVQLPSATQMQGVTIIDVLDETTLKLAGALVWNHRGEGLFSASSSGLNYALTAHWHELGLVPAVHELSKARAVPQIMCVSGSCSPVTAAQIATAEKAGFYPIAVDINKALGEDSKSAEITRLVQSAIQALRQGHSPIVHSALGPEDPRVQGFDATAQSAGLSRSQAAEQVGQILAQVMKATLAAHPVERIVIAGGDSSGAVMNALNIDALTIAASLAPGAPLCQAHSKSAAMNGLELVLKGGQLGGEDFFAHTLTGN